MIHSDIHIQKFLITILNFKRWSHSWKKKNCLKFLHSLGFLLSSLGSFLFSHFETFILLEDLSNIQSGLTMFVIWCCGPPKFLE